MLAVYPIYCPGNGAFVARLSAVSLTCQSISIAKLSVLECDTDLVLLHGWQSWNVSEQASKDLEAVGITNNVYEKDVENALNN